MFNILFHIVKSTSMFNRLFHIVLLLSYVRVKSNRDQAPPPGQPPGNLTFEKIIGQMPAQTGRNHSQMPC